MNLLRLNPVTLEAYTETAWGIINAVLWLKEYRHGKKLDEVRLDLENHFLRQEDMDIALGNLAFKAAYLASTQGYIPFKDVDLWAGLMTIGLGMPTLNFSHQRIGSERRKAYKGFTAIEAITMQVLQYKKAPTTQTLTQIQKEIESKNLTSWAPIFQYATTHHNPLYKPSLNQIQ